MIARRGRINSSNSLLADTILFAVVAEIADQLQRHPLAGPWTFNTREIVIWLIAGVAFAAIKRFALGRL